MNEILRFIGRRADKACAVADEKEEMCQVCRYVVFRRAEAYIHTP